jgi:hypothetical protein
MYSCTEIAKLCDRYISKGGEVVTIEEGCLGYGTMILLGAGLKYAVVQERFVSAWVSTHTVRLYSKLPKKYLTLLNN